MRVILDKTNNRLLSKLISADDLCVDSVLESSRTRVRCGSALRVSCKSSTINEFRKKSNDNAKSQASHVMQAGIEVTIDPVAGIAHNKVMIIDEKKVITGSFNFSDSADTRNAENVLLIDDPEMARGYLNNWMNRRAEARKIR